MERSSEINFLEQEKSHEKPLYFDSAMKNYLHEQEELLAVKNRVLVMNSSHSHILRQMENYKQKLNKLQKIKQSIEKDAQYMNKYRTKKNQEIKILKENNQQMKRRHERQMTNIIVEIDQRRQKIKQESKKIKMHQHLLIEKHKKVDLNQKRQLRQKVYNELKESRATVQHFFSQKHNSIVQKTNKQIKKLILNHKDIENKKIGDELNIIRNKSIEIQELRKSLAASRQLVGQKSNNLLKSKGQKQKQVHPLVRRIENVMNKYTKFI